MKNISHTLGFAVLLGAACSALIAGAGLLTAPKREANEKAERIRNILEALDAPLQHRAAAEEILDVFERDVRVGELGGLEIFEYFPDGADEPVAAAAPFSGPGVWGPIEGVLALEPDLIVIRGVRFYRQEETPGLGGEIASDWFQDQFRGKSIVSSSGEPGFRVSKSGLERDINEVDAITGATMTSERAEKMLDALAKRLRGTAD